MEDQIVASIRRIVRAIDLHSRHLQEAFGLTAPQLATLAEADRLRDASIGALARSVHLSQPTLSGILDRLERRGLVRRKRSARDRRAVLVTVTARGAQVLAAAPSLLQDTFRERLAGLDEWERTALLAALQRIAAMMDADALDAAPLLETGPIRGDRADAAPPPPRAAAPPRRRRTRTGNRRPR